MKGHRTKLTMLTLLSRTWILIKFWSCCEIKELFLVLLHTQVTWISCFVSSSQPFLHIDNYMQKYKQTHTHPFEWQASSEWLALLITDVTQQSVCVCLCVCLCVCVCVRALTVINYPPHAGDLLRLLITSWTKPTGGWFSGTNRESISVWGLVYLSTCMYVYVCAHAWKCVIMCDMYRNAECHQI